ncbi:MAG: radical SAM protein [Pseudomonadota bacterium]
MRQAWRKYLSTVAPRYTSYPSTVQFSGNISEADYAAKLMSVPVYEPLTIDVRLPFNHAACWCSDCDTHVEPQYSRAAPYIDMVLKEISTVGSLLRGHGRPTSIHLTGEAPNYFPAAGLERIVTRIEDVLGLTDNAQMAIELDARLLKSGDVSALKTLGFSRMNLSVKEFDGNIQTLINRTQPFELIARCVDDMREAGVDDVCIDLQYGLPKQTPERFAQTIQKAISLAPDRISILEYAPWRESVSEMAETASSLPDATERAQLVEVANQALEAGGFRRIGFDNYARPGSALLKAAQAGRLHRNMHGFTDEIGDTVVGIGMSAVSYVDGLYVQNAQTLGAYANAIADGGLATAQGLNRSARDNIAAQTISRLLCTFTTDISAILPHLTEQETRGMMRALDRFEEDGVIERRANIVHLFDDAYDLCRRVATAIDPQFLKQNTFQ